MYFQINVSSIECIASLVSDLPSHHRSTNTVTEHFEKQPTRETTRNQAFIPNTKLLEQFDGIVTVPIDKNVKFDRTKKKPKNQKPKKPKDTH